MKPCPYRKEHEYDDDGLCRHCYAKAPTPVIEITQPMSLPEGFVWPGIPVGTQSRPQGVPGHATFHSGGIVGADYWAWQDPDGTHHVHSA